MYHYNFTNDLRISSLDEILKDAANAYLTDTVPSASEDKSKNNNYNTVGFYFNLKAKGNCAKLASNGQIKKVVLNFIKKFQYPNPRTPADCENAKRDGILLAPMRDIVKLLHILTLINPDESFLTKDEIINFIFYNNDLAKKENYNLINTALQIIQYRNDHNLPVNIDIDTSSHEWNQPERQIREMIKTLNYSGCILEEGEKIILASSLSREYEADLFEITTCNSYWTGDSIEDYQNYMDISLEENISEQIKESLIKEIKHPHNRIIFGAPGTGKSYQLNEDAKVFDDNFERVTFHPNYSYAQFVGTYKPIMKFSEIEKLDENTRSTLNILSDKEKSAQEKYDLLYTKFKNGDLTRLPILIGLYSDGDFKTLKQDGTPAAGDNGVEKNHGKAIRPFIKLISSQSDSSEITYSYVPGPFIRVLEKALYSQEQAVKNQTTAEPYLLIIEEINRAVVSAVFGDVFQLLDRNENNESQYEIDVSEDLYNYLTSEDNEETGHKKLNIGKKIRIPSNMFIWATMNSADQGVQPMDAAFKRRWDFEYLPLDKNESLIEKYELPFPKDGAGYQLESWKKIRNTINGLLSKVGNINEDKLLGPFFISENVLKKYNGKTDAKEAKEFADLFKSKVLMYLYEDVCKINPSQVFPKVKSKTGTGKAHFSDVCDEFDKNGIGVFEE